MLTVGSLFTGLGNFDLGFVAAGCRVLFQCEIDDYCQRFLTNGHARKYWSDAALIPDITDAGYDWHQWAGKIDILIGGFPCQPHSNAGSRKGHADHRNLWPQFAGVIGAVRPRAVVLENVASITSPYEDEQGNTHAAYALQVIADLRAMGYVGSAGLISAADAGAPHNRPRWWCVSYADRIGRPESPAGDGTQYEERHDPACEPGRRTVVHALEPGGETLADSRAVGSPEPGDRGEESREIRHGRHASGRDQKMADCESTGLQEWDSGAGIPRRAEDRAGLDSRSQRHGFNRRSTGLRSVKPRLGGQADGLTRWLEFPGWPAPQGVEQHANEPPRVTNQKQDRAARIKALGNALLPQIAYALALGVVSALIEEV